jgi:hypothetical protein
VSAGCARLLQLCSGERDAHAAEASQIEPSMTAAKLDFFDARRRLIHEWRGQGMSPEDIAVRFILFVDQVEAILAQPDQPLPGSSRALAQELRLRVKELEREIHAYREPPSPLPPQASTDVRALLSNPDPALCGCQYWVQSDGVIAPDAHQPGCIFAPKPGS